MLNRGLGMIGIALLASGCDLAVPLRVEFLSARSVVDAYDYVEIVADVGIPRPSNPFTDVSFEGTFAMIGGARSWHVDGFCDDDDGRTFRIRFMPSAAGAYSYILSFRVGSATRTVSGTFHAVDAKRRGPIRVDKEHPWHFIWEGTGEHYFFNGTTAYWLAGWREDRVIESSLERLHRLKINRVRVTIAGRASGFFGERVMDGPDWTPFIIPWPAEKADDIFHPGFDFSRFELNHWRKLERLVRFARDRDIIISLVLDMNDGTVHPGANSEDEHRFIRYAIARFAPFSNVTWDLGDDLDRYRTDAWTRSTGNWVKMKDPYRHLATSHPVDNVHQDRTAEWFDFTSFQEWSRNQHQFMLSERARQKKLGRIIPQTNEEYGYEDHYPLWAPRPPADSSDALRRMAWEIVMAGGYQTTGETTRQGTHVWPDTGGGWINGRGDDTMTMLQGYSHMVDFFTAFPWWKLEPHDELVSGGNFCLASPGDTYVVYLPRGGSFTIQLPASTFEANWFDPTTGASIPFTRAARGRWTSPASPTTDHDWALLLHRAAQDPPK